MITMVMLGKIRRMFYRDGLSRSEIARRTGLSRNTIKKWLRASWGAEPKYRRRGRPGKLGEFKADLVSALQTDAHRLKRDRRTVLALHAQIKVDGYTGGYTAATDFVRHWRERVGNAVATRGFVQFKFELGRPSSLTGARKLWCSGACGESSWWRT